MHYFTHIVYTSIVALVTTGLIKDITGDYNISFIQAGATFAIASACIWAVIIAQKCSHQEIGSSRCERNKNLSLKEYPMKEKESDKLIASVLLQSGYDLEGHKNAVFVGEGPME